MLVRIFVRSCPLLFCAMATACASSPGQPASSPPSDPEAARLEAIFRAREDSARMNVSEADARFMTGMIGHHAQALVMSALAPTHGASPAVQTLTARITNAQTDEIALMQRWLRERERPVPAVDESGHMDHSMHMPGMLSPAQLDELRQAQGRDFDRLFLTFMIQHHEGAVTMVKELFATDGAAQDEFVFKLANDIQVDQTTEVARMQKMLDAMTSGRDSAPAPSHDPRGP
jgi:uncharacterized protein (DUF305 family)